MHVGVGVGLCVIGLGIARGVWAVWWMLEYLVYRALEVVEDVLVKAFFGTFVRHAGPTMGKIIKGLDSPIYIEFLKDVIGRIFVFSSSKVTCGHANQMLQFLLCVSWFRPAKVL